MFRSTTAMQDYTRSATAALDIPDDGTLPAAEEALMADFPWISAVLLNMDGSVLSIDGDPRTEAEAEQFVAFYTDLASRDVAAAASLMADGSLEEPLSEALLTALEKA